jgi:uncharacterized protein YbaP (TraB family)
MPKRFRNYGAWFVTFLTFLVTGQALAQSAPQAAKATRHFLMWKATSPTNTVYLVGSIHVGDSSMYPLPQTVESAFATSKVLAVEINIKNIDQSKMVKLMMESGMYGGDDSLFKHLSKETADALDAFCSKNGLPKMVVEKMKPWAAALTVVAFSFQQAGEDPLLGIDMHFLNEVKEPQRIDELETADFQMSLFASASEQEQQELLASSLKNVEKAKEMIRKMQQSYLAGDADALLKLVHEEESTPKSLMKKMVDDRNVTMTAKVESYLKGKESCFVVVGAAHIIGDKGIVKLLQDKGYRVEQVGME